MRVFGLLLFILIFGSLGWGSPCRYCEKDFAIYAPADLHSGVWMYEVRALESFLSRFGFTFDRVADGQILSGGLGHGFQRKYHGFIMPGGPIDPRVRSLGEKGRDELLKFIAGGGNYIGFCGGSYFAGDGFVWAGEASGGSYYKPQDYKSYKAPGLLSLFDGIPVGPLSWAPYKNGEEADGLEPVEFNLGLESLKAMRLPQFSKLFYFGGPFFLIKNRPAQLEIWGRAIKPQSNRFTTSLGEKMPTIIKFRRGLGTVILFSYHPVVLIDGLFEGKKVQPTLSTPVLKKDPAPLLLNQVNFESWNLLYGAMDIVSDRPMTPLLELHQ